MVPVIIRLLRSLDYDHHFKTTNDWTHGSFGKFLAAMEPESSFTVKLEELTSEKGGLISHLTTKLYVHTHMYQGRKRPRVPPGSMSARPTTTVSSTSQVSQCLECLQSPCVIQKPPFLKSSGMADIGNAHKRYSLYRKFWTYLQRQGLWKDSQYMCCKVAVAYTSADDPWCICQNCSSNCEP